MAERLLIHLIGILIGVNLGLIFKKEVVAFLYSEIMHECMLALLLISSLVLLGSNIKKVVEEEKRNAK